MILCIDSGNSRIKWGLHDGRAWRESGALDQAEAAGLAALPARLPRPGCVMLANVAGAEAAGAIRTALAPWADRLHEVASGASAGGVTNLYARPAQLGVDRWCALVGARGLTVTPCVVVMAGTATTIDTLDADGRFLGGLILPGLDLMRRALARDTAALPLATGHYAPWPRSTDDAIISGAIEAQAGAIERAVARLPAGAGCLISGGAAAAIGERLGIVHRLVANLVLEGLIRLAPPDHAGGKISG